MPNINKVVVSGRLGRDPEVQYLPNGTAACTVSIATTRYWTDRVTGEKKEQTEWHRVKLFGRQAELVGEYKRKGGKLYAEGRLSTNEWTDNNGVKRYTTEIIANEMQLCGRDSNESQQEYAPAPQNKPRQRAQQSQQYSHADSMADLDDDIPF